MFDELFEKFNCDTMHRMQAIFSSIFVLQNRMQTAGDKIQTQISMKQWLLLAMTDSSPEPRTLTNIGNFMGCSRQNVKKLALSLESKGFVRMLSGGNNSVCIELTEKVTEYNKEIGLQQMQALKVLFADFSEEEILQLFKLYAKLYAGVERVENYAEELNQICIK
jgi:DNA-binding MarR family transcriptional regulator